MFDGEFTGDWIHADGQWHPVIHDPTDLDPAEVCSGVDVALPGCPAGAGLAILLAGIQNAAVDDAGVIDRIVGYERLAAWAAAGQARALAELTTRRTATDPNELPYAVEEISLALSCSRIAAGAKVALALDLAQRLPRPWRPGSRAGSARPGPGSSPRAPPGSAPRTRPSSRPSSSSRPRR